MIGPTNTEKAFSLFLALSIQVGLGYALLSASDIGKPLTGTGNRDPGSVLVVELIPLNKAGYTLSADKILGDATPQFAAEGEARPAAIPKSSSDVEGIAQSDAKPLGSETGAPSSSTPAMTDLPSHEAMAWRARVQTHLSRYRLYPPGAAYDGQQGIALVQFTVNRQGSVSQAWVATSSGIAAIDQETIAAILRAQPLPPFPAGWPDTLDIRLPVAFRLG